MQKILHIKTFFFLAITFFIHIFMQCGPTYYKQRKSKKQKIKHNKSKYYTNPASKFQ